MRKITSHQVNECNKAISIDADDRGHGGASHEYMVSWPAADENGMEVFIPFQNGPIKEAGVNGLTHEVLLAILIDRLTDFQNGPYANGYNARALEHLVLAREMLYARTREREARGVEGTHQI